MFVRLRERGDETVMGLVCDETGLHFGGEELIEPVAADGRCGFKVRPIDAINRSLSNLYGASVDLSGREAARRQIADHLAGGALAKAQLLALQLRLPEVSRGSDVQALLKSARLLRSNPNHDERGRFTWANGGRSAKSSYKTPGGTRYSTATRLNARQSAVVGKIVDYGVAHRFRPDQIGGIVNQAFFESSLGTLERNGKNDAKGIFQYLTGEWHDFHHNLNRSSDDDQIIAIFQDVHRFELSYEMGQKSGAVPKNVLFSTYMHLMHNYGPSSVKHHPNFFSDQKDNMDKYNQKCETLEFES